MTILTHVKPVGVFVLIAANTDFAFVMKHIGIKRLYFILSKNAPTNSFLVSKRMLIDSNSTTFFVTYDI